MPAKIAELLGIIAEKKIMFFHNALKSAEWRYLQPYPDSPPYAFKWSGVGTCAAHSAGILSRSEPIR